MFDPTNYNELTVTESPIPGLFVITLPVHGDNRGWFKENYQKEKMEALGLPSFNIVQNNISFNDKAGATRGLHAEPWNKFISTANGRVFGAWCDLRKGPTFGQTFTHEINPGTAIYVPKGVAMATRLLMITSPTPTLSTPTGHQMRSIHLLTFLTLNLQSTGQLPKNKQFSRKKISSTHCSLMSPQWRYSNG